MNYRCHVGLTLFVLTQKSKQKKSRLRPLISKNRRDKGGIRPNSLHRCALELKQRTILNRLSHWFFGLSDDVSPQAVYWHINNLPLEGTAATVRTAHKK